MELNLNLKVKLKLTLMLVINLNSIVSIWRWTTSCLDNQPNPNTRNCKRPSVRE